MNHRTLAALAGAAALALTPLSPTALAARRPSETVMTLAMGSARQGWAMTTTGQVLHTGDGGRQWTNVASPGLTHALEAPGAILLRPAPGGNLIANGVNPNLVAFPNPWTAWIAVPTGTTGLQVWHTSDGGQRWTTTTLQHVGPYGGGVGLGEIAAVGNRDAWIVTTSGALAGHVDIRVWRTSVHHPAWHAVFQGPAAGTSGLVFVNGSTGVLAEGCNLYEGPDSAALGVTVDGGHRWAWAGNYRSPRTSALPLLPGNWVTMVLAPAGIPLTEDVIVPVLMQRPVPAKTTPFKTWWRLEVSTNGGRTWHMLPSTPDPVMTHPPNVIFQVILQAWITQQVGWVVLGSRLDRTTDGGRHWAASRLPAGTVVNLSRVSARVGFALIQHGNGTTIYRTGDGGGHWVRVS